MQVNYDVIAQLRYRLEQQKYLVNLKTTLAQLSNGICYDLLLLCLLLN